MAIFAISGDTSYTYTIKPWSYHSSEYDSYTKGKNLTKILCKDYYSGKDCNVTIDDTSAKRYNTGVFESYDALESIEGGSIMNTDCTSMFRYNYAFTGLTTKFPNVEDATNMLEYTSISEIPTSINWKGVKNLNGTFRLTKLTKAEDKDGGGSSAVDFSNVETASDTFSENDSLTTADLTFPKCTDISNMFKNCRNLNTVILTIPKVTSATDLFSLTKNVNVLHIEGFPESEDVTLDLSNITDEGMKECISNASDAKYQTPAKCSIFANYSYMSNEAPVSNNLDSAIDTVGFKVNGYPFVWYDMTTSAKVTDTAVLAELRKLNVSAEDTTGSSTNSDVQLWVNDKDKTQAYDSVEDVMKNYPNCDSDYEEGATAFTVYEYTDWTDDGVTTYSTLPEGAELEGEDIPITSATLTYFTGKFTSDFYINPDEFENATYYKKITGKTEEDIPYFYYDEIEASEVPYSSLTSADTYTASASVITGWTFDFSQNTIEKIDDFNSADWNSKGYFEVSDSGIYTTTQTITSDSTSDLTKHDAITQLNQQHLYLNGIITGLTPYTYTEIYNVSPVGLYTDFATVSKELSSTYKPNSATWVSNIEFNNTEYMYYVELSGLTNLEATYKVSCPYTGTTAITNVTSDEWSLDDTNKNGKVDVGETFAVEGHTVTATAVSDSSVSYIGQATDIPYTIQVKEWIIEGQSSASYTEGDSTDVQVVGKNYEYQYRISAYTTDLSHITVNNLSAIYTNTYTSDVNTYSAVTVTDEGTSTSKQYYWNYVWGDGGEIRCTRDFSTIDYSLSNEEVDDYQVIAFVDPASYPQSAVPAESIELMNKYGCTWEL